MELNKENPDLQSHEDEGDWEEYDSEEDRNNDSILELSTTPSQETELVNCYVTCPND